MTFTHRSRETQVSTVSTSEVTKMGVNIGKKIRPERDLLFAGQIQLQIFRVKNFTSPLQQNIYFMIAPDRTAGLPKISNL